MPRVNLNISAAEAKRIYIDYYYCGNTRGTNAAYIGQIVSKYGRSVSSWQKSAESMDNNDYEITSSERDKYVQKGREAAIKAAGYKSNKTGTYARAIGDAALATGGRIAVKYGIRKGSEAILRSCAKKAEVEITKEASKEILKASIGELNREALGVLPVGEGIKKLAGKGAQETGKVIGKELGEKAAQETIEQTAKRVTYKTAEDGTKQLFRVNGEKVIEKGGKQVLDKSGTEVVKNGEKVTLQKTGEQVAKEAAETAKCVSVILSCVADGTFAGIYLASKPNEDENKAVLNHTENLGSQQALLANASNSMAKSETKINNYADDACNKNEAANSAIEENMADYAVYACQVEHYDSAVTRGHKLSDDEKEAYQGYIDEMGALFENIGEERITAQEEVSEIRYVMEAEQTSYDNAAQDICTNQGYIEEVSNVDESTAMSAKIEAVAQGLGAAQSAVDATKAGIEAAAIISGSGWFFGAGFVAAIPVIAAGAVAAGAAVSDGLAVAEQIEFSNNAENLINGRETTEAMNEMASGQYDRAVDNFAGNLDAVDDLYLEVPDEDLNPKKKNNAK